MTAQDLERRSIRDAMDRLLAGKSIRSDGKLTIKSLAAEAGVKRWVLTHRHTDLGPEFRDKIAASGSVPEPMRALTADNDRLKQQLEQARADLRHARAETQHCLRVIHVLGLELDQAQAALAGTTATVTPISRRP